MSGKPTAYEAYQALAQAYAERIDSKPHNAFYERPATLSLLPGIAGKQVLDVGCGPGAYTQELLTRAAATVIACDISERMLEHARERLCGHPHYERLELRLLDLSQPVLDLPSTSFDVITAPLCLDYIEDWRVLFAEFHRLLKMRGVIVFSCGHPAFDADYFNTEEYFSVEAVTAVWKGFGEDVLMPGFRRSLEEILSPVIETGFVVERVHEPLPTQAFKEADPVRYKKLLHRPGFLCVRASKRKIV